MIRIIILFINLIYWIVFGGNNSIQIDSNTKELLHLKLMKELKIIATNFFNTNFIKFIFFYLLLYIESKQEIFLI